MTNCQILLRSIYHISEPFDLRPTEGCQKILFRIRDDEKDGIRSAPIEAFHFSKQTTTQWESDTATLTLDEDDYHIKVISDDSVSNELNIRLSKDIYWSVDTIH